MTVSYTLTAEDSAPPGSYVGFQLGFTGSLAPAAFLETEANILRAQHDLVGSDVFYFSVDAELDQDAFISIVLPDSELGEVTYLAADATYAQAGGETAWYWTQAGDAPLFVDGNVYTMNVTTPETGYNCECDDDTGYETLAELRARMMVRLGYAGQVANPPPGMTDLLNDFLVSAQRLLYMKYTELHTERFFTWTMEPGVRFYDLPDNEEECTKRLNALKLTWVGVEDTNGAWYPLGSGIPPEFYTAIPANNSLPQRYEIRQCIEVFPPPDEAYKLRIKGHYKLQPLVANDDQTTIDSELVFLWALATAKAHYGHPDANNVAAMANDYLGRLVGGKHGTKRYVPGNAPVSPAVRPVMRDGFDA